MKKSIVILLALVFLAFHGYAQSLKVSGYIQDKDGPVAAATINIASLKKSTVSDSLGYFQFTSLPVGNYRFTVSAINYNRLEKSVTVNSATSGLNFLLTENKSVMDEVVISGTMRAVSKMASPIPVEVYSPAFFKKNPTPNIFESLQMVNGIQPQLNCNVCNTGDIHINGMEGPYTMILIDGMPIVSSLSTVYGLAGIPNSMVKRIEIVKGPASTLYGSEAVGGLINIITKDAAVSEKLKIDVSATSTGEYNTDITAAIKTKKTAVLLGINYFNYQQRRDINHDNFTDITLQNRISIFNKWNFKRKNNLSASLALRYINEDRWGGEMQWQPAFRGTDSVYGESINTNRAEVIGTIELTKNFNADVSYNYHLQDSYYGTIKYYANQQIAFAQLRWNKNFNSHSLLVGVPFRYTYYDDNSPATAKTNGENKAAQSILPGIFVQDEIKLNEKLYHIGRFTLRL